IKINKDIQVTTPAQIFREVVNAAGKIKRDIIIRQIVENIADGIQVKQKTEIKMFLKPENLGLVIIKLEHKNNN
ncbi:hypothetical protein DRQ09_08495, partial [candidate division KSB1 bacterium]